MSLYNECTLKVSALLLARERYEQIIVISEKAVSLYPFEEELHKLLLFAYLKAGRSAKPYFPNTEA